MIIAELIAELGFDLKNEGDLTRFNKGLDQTQQHVERFASRISTMQIALGSFFGNIAANLAMRIGHAIGSIPGDILNVGKKFEAYGIQLKALEGSQEAANKAMEWIEDFAKRTPLELDGVVQAFAQMRTFGLDPTNGSLQALVDTMAMSGGKAAELQGIILPLGQAWTAQKLQTQDANQLLQRGVPVWDLLSKAMGKSVAQIQKMASAGKLGRKEIQLLIDEMGKRAAGASEAYSKSFEGIVSNISDIWTGFLKKISDSGFYDDITRKLKGVQDTLEAWDKDGTLHRWAHKTGKAFESVLSSAGRYAWGIWALGEKISEGVKLLTGGKLDMSTLHTLEGVAALLLRRFMPLTFWITAASLAIDDFLAYLKGDKSVIGEFVMYIQQLTGASEGLAQAIAAVAGGLGLLFLMKPGLLLGKIGKKLPAGAAVGAAAGSSGGIGGAAGFLGALGRLGLGAGIVAGIANLISSYGPDVAKKTRKPKDGEPASWLGFDPTESREARLKRLNGGVASGKGDRVRPQEPSAERFGHGASQPTGMEALRQALANMQGNLARMDSGNAALATLNDNRQDNRDQSVNPNITINQTVTQATQAPMAAAQATGSAVGRAAVPMAGRLAIDSAF